MQRMLAAREVTQVASLAINKLKPKGSQAEKEHMFQAAMHAMEADTALLTESLAASTAKLSAEVRLMISKL